MKSVIALYCLAAITVCSAQEATVQRSERPNVTIEIDARPGEYERFTSAIENDESAPLKTFRAVLVAKKLQPSVRWAPAINLCFKVKSTGSEACLNVTRIGGEGALIPKVMTKADAQAKPQITELPFALDPEDAHYLDVLFVEKRTRLILNDRVIYESERVELPDEYWLSCSSIVCGVQIHYPYATLTAR